MGSVPNCQKEIPMRHAIRWFKCKLKTPKKGFKQNISQERERELDNVQFLGESHGFLFQKLVFWAHW